VAGIFHPGHVDAGPVQVGRGGVAVGVGGEHHRALAGPDRVQVDQAARRGGEHDAGQVVAGEDVGPFDQAGRHDQDLGPGPDQLLGVGAALPLDVTVSPVEDGDQVAVVAAEYGRVGEYFDTGFRGYLGF
jgi:hypothetical protein